MACTGQKYWRLVCDSPVPPAMVSFLGVLEISLGGKTCMAVTNWAGLPPSGNMTGQNVAEEHSGIIRVPCFTPLRVLDDVRN